MYTKPLTDKTCVRVKDDPQKLRQLKEHAFSNDHLVALAAFMSSLGNETRLRMLYVLWQANELCVCDLADIFGITQPAVSRHLRILREKALVDTRRDAQTIYYRVCGDNPFARTLMQIFAEQESNNVTLNLSEVVK